MVGSVGILITAMGAVIVNIIVALRTGKKIDESLLKSEAISHQVQEVHTLTNSNLSAVKAELAQAVSQITEMRVLVADLKSERDKLATIAALNTELFHPPINQRKVLESIEKNTENIDTNTKEKK